MKRPDPDTLLARVQQEENHTGKGRLKVFFGMAPGVGKTYAMLSEARERVNARVLVGVVETHGRQDTQALLEGLDVLPPRNVEHNGVKLHEFDLDAALQQHPDVILVDELAHTNAPDSRHAKRWQDVEELLDAGIDVYTTVNVQHLESLNDVVAQITGVQVRETVPDHILECAHEIELIDLTPAELHARLREGKVYVPQSVEQALKNFFREGNLIALRELALRRTAERVDAQMQTYRRDHAVPQTWPACERIVVCIGPHPLSERLVRAARRMATGLHAQWLVAWVETPAPLPEAARERVQSTLRLAESLGAETVQLAGSDVAAELLAFARQRNVSKIVVGKPAKPRWREKLFGSIVDDIVRGSGDIDVYVITGDTTPPNPRRKMPRATSVSSRTLYPYVGAIGIIALCTLVAWAMHRTFSPPNLTMIYLVGVVLAAARLGRGPSVLAALGGVAAYDFFFVPPYYTFAVSDVQYLVTFAVLLGTGLIVSTLTTRVQQAAEAARSREQRTAALYSLTRDLAASRGVDNIVNVALRHTQELLSTPALTWLPNGDTLQARGCGNAPAFAHDPKEEGVARWVFDHASMAGAGTDTLPAARALYLPLRGAHTVEGVLGVQLRHEADATRPVS
ncbi:MAG: sensor histidine kinase KdpD, partial [Abitibacteriaceae bacterium]|nr:sensor histidine kinase KdpD [Abditibacteriaceae bacterium]